MVSVSGCEIDENYILPRTGKGAEQAVNGAPCPKEAIHLSKNFEIALEHCLVLVRQVDQLEFRSRKVTLHIEAFTH